MFKQLHGTKENEINLRLITGFIFLQFHECYETRKICYFIVSSEI